MKYVRPYVVYNEYFSARVKLIENGIIYAHFTCTAANHLKSALGIMGAGFCSGCIYCISS